MRPLYTSRLSHALQRLALVGTLLLYCASRAGAEWYIGGYGGLSNPGAFSNVTLSDPTLAGGVNNARLNDLELNGGLTGGAKGGYFFYIGRSLASSSSIMRPCALAMFAGTMI